MKRCYYPFLCSMVICVCIGCSNNDGSHVDKLNNTPSLETEQHNNKDGNTIISRKKYVHKKMDESFEKIDTESYLEINDILDSEKEFLVSDEWEMQIVYIYLLSDKRYEKHTFFLNYSEHEKVTIHLSDDITEMYVLCPEYTNVEVLTKSNSSASKERALYLVDENFNTEAAGGDLRYRIFDVDFSVMENIQYELCDEHESDDYKTYGGFVIQFE